jgi:hypothetical protein
MIVLMFAESPTGMRPRRLDLHRFALRAIHRINFSAVLPTDSPFVVETCAFFGVRVPV